MYLDLPYANAVTLNERGFITAVYLLTRKSSCQVLSAAGKFAIGQTVGTWLDVPGITKEMRETFLARVTGVYYVGTLDTGVDAAVLCVAFPIENISSSFALLETALIGNDVSTSLQLRLLDLQFTQKGLELYNGPKKGIPGIRKILGIYHRPLVLNMIKPSLGHSPETGAKLFFESAMGGVDMIKDDEVLGNLSVSSVAKRVEAYGKAAEKVRSETGKYPLYIPNITDTPAAMHHHCKDVLSAGGHAVMINFMTTGYDAMHEISQEFGDDLIIMGHYAGVGTVSSRYTGYADNVALGIFPRLAGADIVMTMFPGTTAGDRTLPFLQTVQSQQLPMNGILPTMTAVGGGLTPFNIGDVVATLGNDIILGVGGAIQGHPAGATRGAKAVMTMLQAIVNGQDTVSLCHEDNDLKSLYEMLQK